MEKSIPRPPQKRPIFVIVECFSVFLNGIQLCLNGIQAETGGKVLRPTVRASASSILAIRPKLNFAFFGKAVMVQVM